MSYLLKYIQEIRPARFFVLFAAFFGLLTLFITPPFQTPDEINHFFRAYQISEGQFIAEKQNDRIGGYIPSSLIKITEPFLGLCSNPRIKTNHKIILSQLHTPLNRNERLFIDLPNTGMYAPISYFPQAFSIFILRSLNIPPLYIFYGARVFTLLFWIFGIFYAIKIIPFYKWSFALIALLPMSVFINMSLSADVVTNLLSFLLITYLLKLAYSKEHVSTKNYILVCILVLLLALAKFVYTPIVLLFLLIPQAKFRSKSAYLIRLILLFGISFGTVLMWSKMMNNLYLPYSMYNVQYRDGLPLPGCVNLNEQMQYILSNGFYLWHVFINSMITTFDKYFQGFIGTFGWLDSKLPLWLIYLSYVILFIVAITDGNKAILIKPFNKILIFASLFLIVGLILLSQHLAWDCVGGELIANIQGRYFIPAFPLLFIVLYNSKFNYSKIVIPVVIVFSFISLSVTINTLHARYYKTPELESFSIKCDAENITKDNLFETNLPAVLLENGNAQSNENARSGKYSVKLTPENQFGFTYRLYNCGLGDSIKIEIWRLGTTGDIIVNSNTKDFCQSEANIIEKDSMGWEHLCLKLRVSKDMSDKEIGIFLYNHESGTSYFDDLVISFKKNQ